MGQNHGKIPCANKPCGFSKTKGKIEINKYKINKQKIKIKTK
jgi:hypothetical protein